MAASVFRLCRASADCNALTAIYKIILVSVVLNEHPKSPTILPQALTKT